MYKVMITDILLEEGYGKRHYCGPQGLALAVWLAFQISEAVLGWGDALLSRVHMHLLSPSKLISRNSGVALPEIGFPGPHLRSGSR